MKFNKRQKELINKINNNKEFKNFKDTFMTILILNYVELCEKLNLELSNNNFKIYMSFVIEYFKIMIQDVNMDFEVNHEKNE